MPDNRTLYEQVILDHNKRPRNYGRLPDADRVIDGHNPLCGDSFKVYLKFDGDCIAEARFDGHGCAISKSSASLMTTLAAGKTREEAKALGRMFREMLASDPNTPLDEEQLGKLMVFAGVRAFPMRIKCAVLPWHALMAGLENDEDQVGKVLSVSTE